MSNRLVAAPHPFKTDTIDVEVPEGLTISQILELAQCDPVLRRYAHVFVGSQYVPRDIWDIARPKAGMMVSVRVVPHGGGGGGKNPLRFILMIAVIAFAAWAGPALAGIIPGLAGSSIAGAVFTAGIGLIGSLLVNAIAPIRPPSVAALSSTETTKDSPTLFIEGARNAPRPYGTIPVVLGRVRHTPPLGMLSYTETIGDAQYLRMLVIWGYGPLRIENIKIGDTPIEDYEGVQIETREGFVTDSPLTLMPDTVLQDDLAILLVHGPDWSYVTVSGACDEISIDLTFPQGLCQYGDSGPDTGKRFPYSASVGIRYRAVGGPVWLTPVFTATTVPPEWLDTHWYYGAVVNFNMERTSAVRHGFRWSVPARGNYEVSIYRTSDDHDSTAIFDKVMWTALRGIVDEDPIQFSKPLAKTALVIKATDQLNQQVDELNAIVSAYQQSFNGVSWDATTLTSNPASAYRQIMQGPANTTPLTDDRLDLDALEDWSTFCVQNGFEFNMIRDFQASIWDTLSDICAAGRASPAPGPKWGVVYDYEQPSAVQHFTPRNSWGFKATKAFPVNPPHGLRFRFQNRNDLWRQDERIIYADGYDASNASIFEGADAPGVTDPAHIWKHGRFSLAQGILRPERWTLNTDFEFLTARRGSLVSVTHDVLLVGLASGRIKSLTYDASSPQRIAGFISDEALPFAATDYIYLIDASGNFFTDPDGTFITEPESPAPATQSYGVVVRSVGSVGVARQVVTDADSQTEVVFSTPLVTGTPGNPAAGDLFGFGLLGEETISGLILDIQPQSEMTAQLVIIPESPEVYTSDTGDIPPFDPHLTPITAAPTASIQQIRSDESVLELGPGNTLITHIAISLTVPEAPSGWYLEVQIRKSGTGEPFYAATVVNVAGTDYLLGNVEDGASYDLRVRWRNADKLPSLMWTYAYNYRVIGQSNPPEPLMNATISVFGGMALIRWDRPNELDVRFGGEIRFRHTPMTDPDLADWQSSTSIGSAARSDALIATLPLKEGCYLARVFDRGGRPSTVVALSTKQASVLTFANVDSVTEDPTFPGVKTNVVVDSGSLKLGGAGLIDDVGDFDAIVDFDATSGIAAAGVYNFSGGFDLGSVVKVRVTSHIDATNINIQDKIDNHLNSIDSWEDFDGTAQSAADARVQVRITDNNPSGSPVSWSIWNDLDSAEFEARGFEFRALLTTTDPAFNIRVDELSVVAEDI